MAALEHCEDVCGEVLDSGKQALRIRIPPRENSWNRNGCKLVHGSRISEPISVFGKSCEIRKSLFVDLEVFIKKAVKRNLIKEQRERGGVCATSTAVFSLSRERNEEMPSFLRNIKGDTRRIGDMQVKKILAAA